jgi:uncharacterized membrane protein (DUF4010 family)
MDSLATPENGWLLLATACAGGFVGLVKQWREGENSVAGMRTFSLWSVLGFVSAQLDKAGLSGLMLASFVLMGFGVAMFSLSKKAGEHFGLTTLSASLLMFIVGGLMGVGHRDYALIIGILVAGTIGLRNATRRWSSLLTEVDVRVALQFTFLTGVILPLVPNRQVWGIFNPYDTWRMVLLISGVNLLGYVAMRLLGSRSGLPLTGIVGGLASSTAVTLAFSRKSKVEPQNDLACAQAILLAGQSMFVRVWIVTFMLSNEFGIKLLPAFVLVTLTGLLIPGWLAKKISKQNSSSVPDVKNPLNLFTAIKFGLLYAVLVFLLEQTKQAAESMAFLAISFISGLLTMDAITISLANRISEDNSGIVIACAGVLVAMASNTIVKMCIALWLGNQPLRRWVAIGSAITLVSIALGWGLIVLW